MTVITPNRFAPLPASAAVVLALAAMFAGFPAQSFGFLDVDGNSLTLETRLSETWESYFVGTSDHHGDTYATLAPQLLFVRSAGLVRLTADGGVRFTRYGKRHKSLDSEDAHGAFRVSLPDPKEGGNRLTGSFNFGYFEGLEISQEVDERIYAETLSGGANFEYAVNPESAIGEGFSYSKSTRNVFSDQTLFQNDLSYIYYGAKPGANARLVHTYNRTQSSGSKVPIPTGDPLIPLAKTPPLDQNANSISTVVSYPVYGDIVGQANLGYRVLSRSSGETRSGETTDKGLVYGLSFSGPLISSNYYPTVQNSFSIGYQASSTPGVNDSGGKTLTGALNFAWQPRDTTRFNFHLTRAMTLGVTDQTIVNTSVGGGVSEQLGRMSVHANADYVWRDYKGVNRSDSQFDFSAGASLPVVKFLDIGVDYLFTSLQVPKGIVTTRGETLRDYDRHMVTGFVTVRF